MSTGLQRRRGGGGAASETGLTAPASTSSTPAGSTSGGGGLNGSNGSSRPTTPAPATTPSGHRIAYDERDLESGEEKVLPKLTLMEEVLLLGLKDKQGYLSFWNDNISYTLRGCIILELALRHRIAMVRDPNRRRFPLADRYIEVVDERLTGEVLLDEALKMMKVSEKMSVGTWIDLMSGETWNVMKIGYQLKQVRERLAKGLVDKGVLRTEKRNFLLFDMATHPVSDPTFKDDVLQRTLSLLTTRTAAVPSSSLYSENVRYRTIRAVSMVCAAFAANVLENALVHLGYDAREAAFAKCDELLAEFSQWPFGAIQAPPSGRGGGIGAGTGVGEREGANLAEIGRLARAEIMGEGGGSAGGKSGGGQASKDDQTMRELHLEIVAAALEIFRRMDSLL
ncbi:Golgi phosphoprotein 3 [Meredithblackwellia eburnea MCA 4105]